jgi:hypothetical protein
LGEAELVEEGKVGDGELLYIKVLSHFMPLKQALIAT